MRKPPAPVKWINRLLSRTLDLYGTNYAPSLAPWRAACIAATKDLKKLRDAMPAYTPKRPSYYGAKGSLRNPFRA